jgi:hypothetical protein
MDEREPPDLWTLNYSSVPVPRGGGAVGPFFAGAFLGIGGLLEVIYLAVGAPGPGPFLAVVVEVVAFFLTVWWLVRSRRRVTPFVLGIATGLIFVPLLLVGACFVALSTGNLKI